jgi:putative phosphotransacetylase
MNETEKQVVEKIVLNTVMEVLAQQDKPNAVPLGVSNKHLHLCQEHVEILFGKGHELTKLRDLKHPGQFACEECVKVVGPKGEFPKVRVLGPTRPETQVELSLTDCRTIGIKAPVCESGKLEGTPGCTLVGPCGSVDLEYGVMVAARHIHMPPAVAEELGYKDGDYVAIEANGTRPVVFKDVLLRVSSKVNLEMHLDTDEANAAGVGNNDILYIVDNN